MMRSCVISIFLYACFQRRTPAAESRCYRKILRFSYKDHVTNEEVRAKIQQAIGPHEDLTIVKETQTDAIWTCIPFIRFVRNHLARHGEREKRQGRQKKKWENIIREWTGLKFTKSQRAVENRENAENW